ATFGSTLDGNFGLTVAGDAEFDAAVGSLSPLAKLTVTGTATTNGTIHSSGSQNYLGPVVVAANSTFTTNGNSAIDIRGGISGQTGAESLTLNAGTTGGISLLGGASSLGSLVLNDTTTLSLKGNFTVQAINTAGLSGGVVLAGNTQIITASDITLSGLSGGLTGTNALGIKANGKTVDLTNTVVKVGSLNVTASSIKLTGVSTTQGQSYTGTVALGKSGLDNKGSGDITLSSGSALNLRASTVISNSGGGIILGGDVNDVGSAGTEALTLSAPGQAISITGDVGGTLALSNLKATARSITLAKVITAGSQNYAGTVDLTDDLAGTSLAFSSTATISKPVLLTADAINFGGPVKGTTTLAIITKTPTVAITIGTASSGLVLSSSALSGYSGLLYIGAVPKAGGVTTGVFGVPESARLATSITVDAPIHLGKGGTLVLVSAGNITLDGTATDLISADTVVLAATGSLLDPGSSAGITSDNISLAAQQIGATAADSVSIYPAGQGAPIVQVGSGTPTSNIGGDNVAFETQQPSTGAPYVSIYDTDVGVVPVSATITNAGQQSAANQQTGGLLTSGFIDVSVFQQISLYDVNGSGISLPADQCEEQSSTGQGCGQ
ncbi:MAG TPA: hypothetical protein VLG68_08195, partial [Gammaproteobacteria bacterium]|nr:hypothetical protein [Gammaproteobacteria bacterium]